MKIHVDVPVLTLEKTEFQPPMQLRGALYMACLGPLPGDERLSLMQKLELHALGARINTEGKDDGHVNLTAEEVAKLKERVSVLYSIHPTGQIVALLESPKSTANGNAKIAEAVGTALA